MTVFGKLAIRWTLCVIGLLAAASSYSQEWIYAVRPGDNLWELSRRYLKQVSRWADLQELNKIADPQRIPPGTLIRVPIAWLKHQPVPARVVDVRGSVEVTANPHRPPQRLIPGAELHAGACIETDTNSSATIQFADQSLLLIQADSVLVLDTLSAFGQTGMVDTRARLRQGRGESQVVPSKGPASRYQITTPAAVTAVRGTSFRVATTARSDTTRAEVIEGRVEVEGGGVRRLVAAGFGVVAEVGKPPSKPRKLLLPPELGRLPSTVKRLPVAFQWPPVAEARAYRAQIFADATFQSLLLEQHIGRPRVKWDVLPDGDYVLRVRGIDDMGLEGLDAAHRFMLDTGPKPPLPLKPSDGVTLRTLTPQFSWAAPTSAASVRLQLARDASFNDIVLELTGYASASVRPPEALSPGLHYWRLASQRANGDAGPFGAPRRLRLLAVPTQPRVRSPSIEQRTIRTAWAAASHAARYRCQLARTPEFTELVEELVVTKPQCHSGTLPPGAYYLRAQGISDEGITGPFSKVLTVEVTPPTYLPFVIVALLLLLLLLV